MAQLIPTSWKHALDNLREEVHHVLDRWLPRRETSPDRDGEFWAPSLVSLESPGLDLTETDDEVVVTAELPGLDKEDVAVEVSGDRVLIRGEKKAATERKGRGYYSAEQSYEAFARAVALPCEVDADKATAKYKNGTLRLALPKTEQARAQRVKVHIRGA
jgi:HSP20 family protein